MDLSSVDFSMFHKNGSKSLDINPDNWENWKKPELEDFGFDAEGNQLMVDKDPLLRPPDVKLPLTPEHFYEYMRCSVSPHYFMANYCVVKTYKGFALPEPRDYQVRLLTHIHEERHNAAMMPRQSGKTVTVGAYIAWYVTFHADKTALILAHQRDIALEHLQDRIQPMLRHLPKWMQQGAKSFIKTKVELENGSRVVAAATTKRSGAGMAINLLYLDEFALVEPHKANDFISSIMPTISSMPDSKVIITSTPRGMNHFHKMYKEDNDYIPFGHDQVDPKKKVTWREIPRYDTDKKTGKVVRLTPEEFKAKEIKNIGELKWNQEYECRFLGSSNTLINGDVLETLAYEKPIETKHEGNLKIFEKPIPGNIYVCGVDVSYGLGKDRSAFSVVNVTSFPYKQAASYANDKISDRALPVLLKEIGMFYNEAMMVVENNGPGARVAEDLWADYEYDFVFKWHPTQKYKATQWGIRTTPSLKIAACRALKDIVENHKLLIHCKDTIEELYKFVANGNSWAADSEEDFDDRVMSLVMAAFFISLPEFEDYLKRPMNFVKDILGETVVKINKEMGSLFEYHGVSIKKKVPPSFNEISYSEDNSWLFM